MKITRVPDCVNASKILWKKIREQNSVCPFCGETRNAWTAGLQGLNRVGVAPSLCESMSQHWYGKMDSREHPIRAFFRFKEKSQHWRVHTFCCRTCGAEWESDPYPDLPYNGIGD